MGCIICGKDRWKGLKDLQQSLFSAGRCQQGEQQLQKRSRRPRSWTAAFLLNAMRSRRTIRQFSEHILSAYLFSPFTRTTFSLSTSIFCQTPSVT